MINSIQNRKYMFNVHIQYYALHHYIVLLLIYLIEILNYVEKYCYQIVIKNNLPLILNIDYNSKALKVVKLIEYY